VPLFSVASSKQAARAITNPAVAAAAAAHMLTYFCNCALFVSAGSKQAASAITNPALAAAAAAHMLTYVCIRALFVSAGSKQAASAITNPAVAAAAAAHMLTWEDALWLATAGGAAVLGLQDKVGHFAVGMEFDALLVDVGAPGSVVEVLTGQGQPLLLLEQFLNNGDDRNIAEVYVQGRRCV
jgi:cytosine/adenosine deaminase-related metal-dependent hydrolase